MDEHTKLYRFADIRGHLLGLASIRIKMSEFIPLKTKGIMAGRINV